MPALAATRSGLQPIIKVGQNFHSGQGFILVPLNHNLAFNQQGYEKKGLRLARIEEASNFFSDTDIFSFRHKNPNVEAIVYSEGSKKPRLHLVFDQELSDTIIWSGYPDEGYYGLCVRLDQGLLA